ncbi:RagB/SusD family nutrient uptake outer membrane protein [Pedobacter nyackensis]|uniref:RagB/SusD family nutrient uptake outer membrane protein n=1 Tax=Pedobacter nyackensis TaxID=475255 RepID=UPI00292CCF54|nr:RagB/SusD family nutrient uptake outer membrane protein [Pedobacter nyackensis]
MKIKLLLLVTCLITLSETGCKKSLDINSTNMVKTDQMWKVKNDARSAVFATYGLLRAALSNENAFFAYGELRGGDFSVTNRQDISSVVNQDLNADYGAMSEWKDWRRFYAVIAQANLCLEKLSLVTKNDFRYREEDLKLDMANVRFLRALSYFYIARIWGNAPLIRSNTEGSFTEKTQASEADLLSFAAAETADAAKDLPWRYDGKGPEQLGLYYGQTSAQLQSIIATKAAAYALAAHIAAWQGDYATTEKNCELVIDNNANGGYNTTSTGNLTSSSGIFSGQGFSVIFSINFAAKNQEASIKGHVEDWTLSEPFIAKKTPDIYIPKDSILKIFNESNDARFSLAADGSTVGSYFTNFSNSIPMFSKIKNLSVSQTPVFRSYQSAIVIFRLEEIMLLRAEAKVFLNYKADAVTYLNQVRTIRGLSEFASTDGNTILETIFKERRRELLGEGWRWYDLIRLKKVKAFTKLTDADIAMGATKWPISKSALNNNGKLVQNKFWH